MSSESKPLFSGMGTNGLSVYIVCHRIGQEHKLEINVGSTQTNLWGDQIVCFADSMDQEFLAPQREKIRLRKQAFDDYLQSNPSASWCTFEAGFMAAEKLRDNN